MLKNRFHLSLLFLATLFAASCSNEIKDQTVKRQTIWPTDLSAIKPSEKIENQIDSFLGRMSLEEKIGQIIQPEIAWTTPEDVKKYHLGSVLNGGGSMPNQNKYASLNDWVTLADQYYESSMDTSDGYLAIPIIWGTDAVHGLGNVIGATLFPHNIGLGAANNPDLIERIGWATAREISITGLDWNFSPTVAVTRDDRWGRSYESWSENPKIVSAYASALVRGLQGTANTNTLFSEGRVIASAKHFIGDGGTLNGIDRGITQGTEQELRDIHGAGYFSAIESGLQVVMASFSSWQGMQMHGHKYLLTDILKNTMGFDGLVVGDWNGHMFIPGCTVVDCPESLMAGLDIYMVPDPNWKQLYRNLLAQAQTGEITAARLDDAVRRILRVKIRAGLFDAKAPSKRKFAGNQKLLGAQEHRDIARQAVRESLVVLKNKNNILPLSRNQTVLVAGDAAHNIGKQSGGWSVTWQGTGNTNKDFPGATSIFEGIQAVVADAGGEAILSPKGSFSEKPDVAIVVFGEEPYAEMQGDIKDISYKPNSTADWELLKHLKQQGIPVVSLFISGRPLWVNREINASDAFVAIWLPGTEGQGIADVIFRNQQGEINYDAKGRLSFSWPATPTQTSLNVGDSDYDPLFPFGYGLSFYENDTLEDTLSEQGIQINSNFQTLDLFDRRPLDDWKLEITGSRNDQFFVDSKRVKASSLQVTAADRHMQEDARRVQWNGSGEGSVAFSAGTPKDLSLYVNENSAFVLDVKVDGVPTKNVYLKVGCGFKCVSELDLTDKFMAISKKGWQTLTVPLRCLKASTENSGSVQKLEEFWAQIEQPFSLTSRGALDISFSKISIVKNPEVTVSCP
ncbi:Beta-glucosidase BoGH3B [Thalassocella blandensis]|nr:Beta-glucosidase BoGH3B [Thalassocella blandensis]